jgi:CheY-like chemotaxis protein
MQHPLYMANRKIIMIVDDDPDDRAFFCEALSEVDSSIECISVKGGEEALQHLEKYEGVPDYIFLDLNMPRMDGKQCLKHIKSNSNLSSIPVIIYTTSKSQEDIEEMKGMGAVYFLTKPNKFSDLKKAIREILD